jgi:methyltransferase family protein
VISSNSAPSEAALLFVAYLLRELGRKMKIFAFDTFQGMPRTNQNRDLHNEGDFRDADLPGLNSFIETHALVEYLVPIIGRFEETLPMFLARGARMSLVHVDCDIYEPTRYLPSACRPHMQVRGYVIFDDPLFSSCIGAFDAMAEEFIRNQALLPEQVYPHLVFPNGCS